MKKLYFVLFIVGILSFFSVLFARYYLLGNWSTALVLMVVDSLLLTIISFLKIER